jgi:hypothetical protein
MFDDLETAEAKTEESGTSSNLYRWAHFPALLVLGIFMLLLHSYSWGWEVAIACSYTVYVYLFSFGQVLRDADDFFGDSRVSRYALELLPMHFLALALLIPGVWLWFHLRPSLPGWVTQEGRKGSFWDLLGWWVLAISAVAQGYWMARRIKRRFGECED